MKTAEELQANKILWALYEAVRQGEPMDTERTIVMNGLKEYHQQKLAEVMPKDGCKIIENLNAATPLTTGTNPIQWDGSTFEVILKGNEINELVEILSQLTQEEK